MTKTNNILLSVIIPLYNNEKEIARAIDSVLNQTWKEFELIVVNDGSTDNSASIVKQYYDHRIKLIQQPNSGPGAARNRGIKEAIGKIVAFLDADDEWKPEHLKRAMHVLKELKNLRWYSAGYERRTKDGKLTRRLVYRRQLEKGLFIENFFDAFEKYEFFCTCTIVVKKTVFEHVGFFDENKLHGEDTEMWIRIALKYPEMGYSKKIGAVNWVNSESLTMKECILTPEISLRAIKDIEHLVGQMGKTETQMIQPYMRKSLKKLINLSIKEKNWNVLSIIMSTYGSILDRRSFIMIKLFRIIPYWVADYFIRFRRLFIKW
jgi:glycosyltransferase involved in cell wall biosynthesis